MIGMFKTFGILAVVGGSAFMAQPAEAAHVSIGLGLSLPWVQTYAAPPAVYYQPAYVPPAVTYAVPTTSGYYTPTYTAPAVVYAPPPVVYYTAPVYSLSAAA